LRSESDIRASHLLYFRAPKQHPCPRLAMPVDLAGRRLFLFQKEEGVNNVWEGLSTNSKV
jgi:hypothetical protein